MYLEIYKKAGLFAFLIVLSIIVFSLVLKTKDKNELKQRVLLSILVLIWGVISFILSKDGFYSNSNDLAGFNFMVISMLIPLIIFFILLKNQQISSILDNFSHKAIIGLQVYRLFGSVFLFIAFNNDMPGLFAIPPGILDVLIATTAVLIIHKQIYIEKYAKMWNYLGLLDFALAFGLYFLYHPFKILEVQEEQIVLSGQYPLTHIITFFVPLAVILHTLSLRKLRQQRKIEK